MFTIESEKYQLAQKISGVGIWLWNLKDNSLTWDQRLYEIYGVTPTPVGVTYQMWASLVNPEDLKVIELSASRVVEGHSEQFDHVFRAKKQDGTPLWIRTVANLNRDDEGRPHEILGANFDVTMEVFYRKALEDEKARLELASRQNLRNSVRILGVCQDITVQTQKDIEGEQQRNLTIQQARLVSLGQLAGGVGHEINNPLAIILGFTQKMLRKKESLGLNEEIMSGLLKIQDASNRIKKIIDGLRALARPPAEDLVVESNLKEGESKIRVVLVTNDSEQQQSLQEYFNKFEFHVKVLTSYSKALDFLSRLSEIDLVLVDSEILGMDGLNFIAELNQNGYVKSALKIILGSVDSSGIEARTRDFRFGTVDGFMEKPIKEKDLNRLMYRLAHRDPLAS